MINGIRQKAIVGKGGRIEVLSPELPMGATVEIIILPLEKTPPQIMVKNQGWRDKLARATQIRTKIAARRGKPLTPAVDIINQTREERNEFFDLMH